MQTDDSDSESEFSQFLLLTNLVLLLRKGSSKKWKRQKFSNPPPNNLSTSPSARRQMKLLAPRNCIFLSGCVVILSFHLLIHFCMFPHTANRLEPSISTAGSSQPQYIGRKKARFEMKKASTSSDYGVDNNSEARTSSQGQKGARRGENHEFHRDETGTQEKASLPGLQEHPISWPQRSQDQDRLRKLTAQCGRTYSDSLHFSTTISTGGCPALPHVSLGRGRRVATGSYPGVFEVEGCEFKWFEPHEACDLLGSVGKILFKGDSLIRQLIVGVGAVLDGDFRLGGIAQNIPMKYWMACQCERQWQCHKDPANHRLAGEPQFALCSNWTRNHVLTTKLAQYDAVVGGPVTIITNGNAMHSGMMFGPVQETLEEYLLAAQKTNGTLIPMTIHFPTANKPPAYRKSQGEGPAMELNKQMLKWAERNNLWTLNTFEYTRGIWSRD
eukprot:2042968-Rhodomonas_salina.1